MYRGCIRIMENKMETTICDRDLEKIGGPFGGAPFKGKYSISGETPKSLVLEMVSRPQQ